MFRLRRAVKVSMVQTALRVQVDFRDLAPDMDRYDPLSEDLRVLVPEENKCVLVQCVEGIGGNGSCLCEDNFRGSRCQYCSASNKYGPKCDTSKWE